MRANVKFNDEALKETRLAIKWYRERSHQAARNFIAELDRAIAVIQEAPHRWPEFVSGQRRIRLTKYPYWIVYREISTNFIEIVAVAHMRRRPGYWLGRSM
jgi:plasmid stabilization system protein ParE